ncbi:alpha/beta fold hydrolase [Larkinella terrae]|uniref:Alpha/beta fold hydrolase n=1 Tax=Larkinella terrae TaxID=2025311 RepID=A0A7K0EMC7_9BACT|nr:alpha/beta hydrolase [Larkinella terrae]MRS62964.1 alpha/beta fold hydrolase [Larkinella terrae]
MKPHRVSSFKKPAEAALFLEKWNQEVEALNGFSYERITISTSFGNTRIWAANTHLTDAKPVVFFPGARTCGLFWDMDNALKPFRENHRFYIVDVNGQPSLSDGMCPNLKSTDYGVWATELLDGLGLKKTTIVGASLGGLICLKLCLESPRRVKKAILMNPAGIQAFSTSVQNLYNNLLPILWPTMGNLNKFLDKAIFCPPRHAVPDLYRSLISEYLLYALTNHKFRGDYPAPLEKEELHRLTTEIYLILGENDPLFPPNETIRLAEEHILTLQGSQIIPSTGHGIETSKEALAILWEIVNKSACFSY